MAENENANVENETTEVKDTKSTNKEESKVVEKKYTDEDVNNISTKNVNKALQKQLKDLGIDDIEEAKEILAKAKKEKEAAMSIDEKTQKIIEKAQQDNLRAIDMTIENALLRKKVDDSKVTRAKRLVDKKNIINENGEIDETKLNSEIEAVIKDFPELVPITEEQNVGFKIGSDGKEDKKEDPMNEMRKIMGLKEK